MLKFRLFCFTIFSFLFRICWLYLKKCKFFENVYLTYYISFLFYDQKGSDPTGSASLSWSTIQYIDVSQKYCILLYSRNKRESSGGVSIVYFTTNIWKTTRQCTQAITLRRSAMSVKFHSNCLLCSQFGFIFLQVSSLWTGFSFFDSLDGVCRSQLTLLESEYCPTSLPTRNPEGIRYKSASPGPKGEAQVLYQAREWYTRRNPILCRLINKSYYKRPS